MVMIKQITVSMHGNLSIIKDDIEKVACDVIACPVPRKDTASYLDQLITAHPHILKILPPPFGKIWPPFGTIQRSLFNDNRVVWKVGNTKRNEQRIYAFTADDMPISDALRSVVRSKKYKSIAFPYYFRDNNNKSEQKEYIDAITAKARKYPNIHITIVKPKATPNATPKATPLSLATILIDRISILSTKSKLKILNSLITKHPDTVQTILSNNDFDYADPYNAEDNEEYEDSDSSESESSTSESESESSTSESESSTSESESENNSLESESESSSSESEGETRHQGRCREWLLRMSRDSDSDSDGDFDINITKWLLE
jgi:hypothetical protein